MFEKQIKNLRNKNWMQSPVEGRFYVHGKQEHSCKCEQIQWLATILRLALL